MALNRKTASLTNYDDNIDLPFEALKQVFDNSTGYVRATMIRNVVKKMQSLNYDGKFIAEYMARLKGIPAISKKHDSKDDCLAADCLHEWQGSKNQDSENQDSESQEDSENQEDSRPVPITSLKINGFPDRDIKKL